MGVMPTFTGSRWTRRCLSVSRNLYYEDELLEEKFNGFMLKRLVSYAADYKGDYIKVILLLVGSSFLSLVPAAINMKIINEILPQDGIVPKGALSLSVFFLSMWIVLSLGGVIADYISSKVSITLGNKIICNLREDLFRKLMELSFDYYDSRPTGKILARIIGDINSLKDVLSNSVTTLIPDFITICAVVGIMFFKNAKLAAAALMSIPLMMVGVWFIQVRSHKRWQIFRKKSSNLNAFVHEDLSGIRIIQSFTAETETKETFRSLVDEHQHAFMDAVRYADAFGSVVDFCWGLGNVSLWFTGIMVLGVDNVSVGTLVAFGTYISMFWQPIMNLSNFYNQLITNISGAERIFEILDTGAEIVDADGVTQMPEIIGTVDFEHVGFSYDENTNVLNDVSFHIRPGETIALVGPTGAGKTTIVNLISRFYDIQKGTIRENIAYGKLDATDEEIIAAAKAVHAHDFISKLPDGYDTKLEERGGGLSVGQKQLLAFARTMVSMPKILILDEATSSIDTKTELLVQDGIEALLKGRTSFVIAHRLSTIQKADRIFVIDNGGIVEEGNARELMAKKGAYYRLYTAQLQDVV